MGKDKYERKRHQSTMKHSDYNIVGENSQYRFHRVVLLLLQLQYGKMKCFMKLFIVNMCIIDKEKNTFSLKENLQRIDL